MIQGVGGGYLETIFIHTLPMRAIGQYTQQTCGSCAQVAPIRHLYWVLFHTIHVKTPLTKPPFLSQTREEHMWYQLEEMMLLFTHRWRINLITRCILEKIAHAIHTCAQYTVSSPTSLPIVRVGNVWMKMDSIEMNFRSPLLSAYTVRVCFRYKTNQITRLPHIRPNCCTLIPLISSYPQTRIMSSEPQGPRPSQCLYQTV